MYNNVSIKYDRGTRQTDDTFLQLQSFSTYILYGIWYIFYHYNIMFQSNDVFGDLLLIPHSNEDITKVQKANCFTAVLKNEICYF